MRVEQLKTALSACTGIDANDNGFRVYEDGRIEPKGKGSKK